MKNFLSLLLFAFTCTAQAQTADFVELIPSPYLQKDLTVSAGLGIALLPKYADGSKQEILPLPLLDMQWKSGVFFSTISGYGYDFSSNPSWQYGVRLGLIAAQEQSASNHDYGPGNTPTDLAPGVFANYLINNNYAILTALSSGAGIGKQHDGFLASVGGRYTHQIDDRNRMFAILGTTWASLHYMQDYYGITPQQAETYHYPIYEANAGMLKVKLSLGWNWDIDNHWSLITGGSLTQPLGDARDSPLSTGKTQVVLYSAGYYRF